jgi:AbrB family looped-hinge helix DNA binding protein
VKAIQTTMTQRGQVTVPAEVRRLLGLKPRQKVSFAIEGEEVRILPAAYTIETAFASVKPRRKPEDFKALSRRLRDKKARETLAKLRRA